MKKLEHKIRKLREEQVELFIEKMYGDSTEDIDTRFNEINLEIEKEKKEKAIINVEAKKICSVCGEEYEGEGNNAEPINNGLCCDSCNNSVALGARLDALF